MAWPQGDTRSWTRQEGPSLGPQEKAQLCKCSDFRLLVSRSGEKLVWRWGWLTLAPPSCAHDAMGTAPLPEKEGQRDMTQIMDGRGVIYVGMYVSRICG